MPLTRSDKVMSKGFEPLAGYRNKIINGDFEISQRGATLAAGTGLRYLVDRWYTNAGVSTIAASPQKFLFGSTEVPGAPTSYHAVTVASGGGGSNFACMGQKIEGVKTLTEKKATLTFWARTTSTPKKFTPSLIQDFGVGGSPRVPIPLPRADVGLFFTKFTYAVVIPSVFGKTLGTVGDFLGLEIFFDDGANLTGSGLGNQSGDFHISNVSLVEGDATGEENPFSPRHIQQEFAMCQRYYERGGISLSTGRPTNKGMTISAEGSNGASVTNIEVPFKVRKRVEPSVVLYDIDGVAGSISGRINTGVYGATIKNPAIAAVTRENLTVYSNWGVTTGARSFDTCFDWRADAEI